MRGKAPAGVTRQRPLKESPGTRIDGSSFYCSSTKDGDPHLKIRRLLDQRMFLRWKKPQQITTENLISSIAEQICSSAPCDNVQFEFYMMMMTVGGREIGVAPDASIEDRRQFESSEHNNKK